MDYPPIAIGRKLCYKKRLTPIPSASVVAMNPNDLITTNKRLLSHTAILSLAALLSGHAAGILAGQWSSDAIADAGFAGHRFLAAPENIIKKLAHQLGENLSILTHPDLPKLTGLAIARGIRTVADLEPPEFRESLHGLAARTADNWRIFGLKTEETEECAASLKYKVSAHPGECEDVGVMEIEAWESLVRGLMQQYRQPFPEDAIAAIALHLHLTFPNNLREILKDDAVGEQTFKRMLLDLHRESMSILKKIEGNPSPILSLLESMPTSDKMYAALAQVESDIRQDSAEVKQILRQLLLDFRWLQAKLNATDVKALLADFEVALESPSDVSSERSPLETEDVTANQALQLVQEAIRLSASILAEDKAQLAGQLWGRLLPFVEPSQTLATKGGQSGQSDDFLDKIPLIGSYLRKSSVSKRSQGSPLFVPPRVKGNKGEFILPILPEIEQLLAGTKQSDSKPWFRSLTPTLTPPGGLLLRTLTGHNISRNAVAVTPDGRKGVSPSPDGTLKLWDLKTERELKTLKGRSDLVKAVAIAPDGSWTVSASKDGTLTLWDLETGKEWKTLTGHCDLVWAIAIAPDSRQAISASWDNTLKLWDLQTGQELKTLTGHHDTVNAVTFTPDGRQAISASADETLKLWDLKTGKVLKTLTGYNGSVYAVAIAPDGRTLVSGLSNKTLKVWDLETGQELTTLRGHHGPVYAIAVTPDGNKAISASHDRTLKLWDLQTKQSLKTLTGHTEAVRAIAVTPDGSKVISASHDRTLKLWDLQTGKESIALCGHTNTVNAIAVTPDGKRVVSASQDKTLKLWDLECGEIVASFTGDDAFWCCAVSPDGVTIVAGESSGQVRFFKLEE